MLDAFCMTALVRELARDLTGGRVDKIFQPERDEVQLAVRSPSLGNVRLLLSVGSAAPRAHLTEIGRENPASPPMFCMFLRKHLTGARIAGITQPPMERVLFFSLDTTDEMGVPTRKTLAAELMGRHSNLIVMDAEHRVLDCLRRVDSEMSEQRPVLPGLFYHLPPRPGKPAAADVGQPELAALLRAAEPDRPADKWLLDTLWGLSPLLARELVHRACGDVSASVAAACAGLPVAFAEFMGAFAAGAFTPVMLLDGAKPVDFSFTGLGQYEGLYEKREYESFSRLLDDFYTLRDREAYARQRAQGLIRHVTNLRDRTVRKMARQHAEIRAARGKERLREIGDLLMAHLHEVKPGDGQITLANWYDPEGKDVDIKLNPLLSPQRNAARYYKDYQRMKTAETFLSEQLTLGEQEQGYLDSVLEALSRTAGERDLCEIREELEAGGYLSKVKRRREKERPSAPLAFRSSSGVRFLAGRNNRQNDQLTLKMADKNDVWLHAQRIPGSHVVILDCEGKPDEGTLGEAAAVAATLSQAKNSPKVPVDYTQVKYVKKPGGAKPGMVIYDRFRTVLAAPDMALMERLRE